MNTILIGYWNRKKEKLKKKYQVLNDGDLNCTIGKEDEMIEAIGCKLGMTKQELLTVILDI